MRPRHKAAENPPVAQPGDPHRRPSMRPRHKAAENLVVAPAKFADADPSMRPRHKAAENACRRSTSPWPPYPFNEAAA